MTPIELDALLLSTCIAGVTVLLCFPGALWAASWAGRLGPRGRWALDAVVMLPLALSPAVIGWALVTLLVSHSRGGPWLVEAGEWHLDLIPEGLVVVNMVMTLPLMIRTMRPAFEVVDHTMVMTARTLGASRWGAWWSITAAQAVPAMVSSMALGFAAAWGESGASVVLASALQWPGVMDHGLKIGTVPLTLMSAMQAPQNQGMAMRLGLVSLAVALAAMLLSEWSRLRWRRRVLSGVARGVSA